MVVPVDRLPSTKFQLDRCIAIGIGLAVLIAIPLIVYYAMSYNSVNGLTLQIASVRRSVSRSFFSNSIDSVTYYVEAHVWSWATSIDTRVNNPTFSLFVDSYSISGASGGSGTFKPYSYLIYSLTFTTFDSTVASGVGQATSNHFILGMDAPVSAGMYQNQITVSDSTTQTFSG